MSITLVSALSSLSTRIFFFGGGLGFAGGLDGLDVSFAATAFFAGAFVYKLALNGALWFNREYSQSS
jgi:hypothetical protein